MCLSSEEEPLSHQKREGLENKLRRRVTNLTRPAMCQKNSAGHLTAILHNGSVSGGQGEKMANIRIEVRDVFNKPVAIVEATTDLNGWRFAYAILTDIAEQYNRTMNGFRLCKDAGGRNAVICEGGSAHELEQEQESAHVDW